jgi:hypothetical protein
VDESLIALIGVVTGAVLTGAVDQIAAARRRKREAQAAARVLVAELLRARRTIRNARAAKEWWEVNLSENDWPDYRDRLAVALSTDEFHRVAAAYFLLKTREDARDCGEPYAPVGIRNYEMYMSAIHGAIGVAARRSRGPYEEIKHRWQTRGQVDEFEPGGDPAHDELVTATDRDLEAVANSKAGVEKSRGADG